ncbi:MAG TPA: CpaF family protein [Phycisphaerae bacterium]|jgi:pilus assembly protein CpaF|nr:CpaF family protein [Phycisphaerae bacterium]HOB75035.1 CpaF family protein [Phycisphaerae bacterium]HOJ54830.1 CpaF family protein [Phycisphaerae bacterium]HOL26892.1 CpaF family protein [Phycisphaerae bacterium]HPP20847.1 CpaF family protein [Phycisphaerae bacterium]
MFGRLKTPVQARVMAPTGAPGNGKLISTPRPPEEATQSEPKPATAPDKNRLKPVDDKLEKYYALKTRIHRKLVEQLDLAAVDQQDPTIRDQIGEMILALCEKENVLLNHAERQRLVGEILDETFGLGPLEVLLKDPTISDILINGPHNCYVERKGKLEKTDVRFRDDAHLIHVIDKIVSAVGRRCDEVSPMVDARLKDGSRVNAVIPPLALDGPSVSIRRFGRDPITWDDYVRFKSCAPEMVEFFRACVIARLNILIVGGTGSGKTTLLNNMSSFIPPDDRIVTIEDAAELRLRQPHVVRLETRPPNIEGKGQITIRDLLINSLRMRPDRIVVGECRGAETLDMLQAMNTGHDGSLTTLHANSTRDAVQRVETMVMMSGFELPVRAIRQQFASAISIIVNAQRLTGGPRKITNVTEVTGMEGDVVTMQDIFAFEQLGVDSNGKAYGQIVATGLRPTFLDRLKSAGCEISTKLFERQVLMRDMDD